MSTKTLIVSGDSHTQPMMYPETPYSWPTYLAQERGWDLINVAKGGGSNTHIFNSLIDTIEQNREKDIIVFAFWSESFRVNFFDIMCRVFESQQILLKNLELGEYGDSHRKYAIEAVKFSDIIVELIAKNINQSAVPSIQHAYECAVNFTLRQMWMMDQWCAMRNIEFYHGSALSPFGDHCIIYTLKRHFDMCGLNEDAHIQNGITRIKKNNQYYKYLNESQNYMGFSFDACTYVIANELNISESNLHPNDQGHRKLSEIISKFINDNVRININNEQYSRPVYIYD